jgi:hypothetical protein
MKNVPRSRILQGQATPKSREARNVQSGERKSGGGKSITDSKNNLRKDILTQGLLEKQRLGIIELRQSLELLSPKQISEKLEELAHLRKEDVLNIHDEVNRTCSRSRDKAMATHHEFEKSFSKLKNYIDRLAEVEIENQRIHSANSVAFDGSQGGARSIYDASERSPPPAQKPKRGSVKIGDNEKRKSIDGTKPNTKMEISKSGAIGPSAELNEKVKELKEKLVFVMQKLNLRNCEEFAEHPLEQIKEALRVQKEIDAEESNIAYVSLERENERLKAKETEIAKGFELEREQHRVTTARLEERVIRLTKDISDLQTLLIEKEKAIVEHCSTPHSVAHSAPVSGDNKHHHKSRAALNKSGVDDFDGVIKSLESDIEAKEIQIKQLESDREFAIKEKTNEEILEIRNLNGTLRSTYQDTAQDLLEDIQHLQEQMRMMAVRHGKEMEVIQSQFKQEINTIKGLHEDEKEILHIKVRSLEKELDASSNSLGSSLNRTVQELMKKYQGAVHEVDDLKKKITEIENEGGFSARSNKDRTRQEDNTNGVYPSSARGPSPAFTKQTGAKVVKAEQASSQEMAIPNALLAQSNDFFEHMETENPNIIKAVAESLKQKESDLHKKEVELAEKENEILVKVQQTELWAKDAENQINAKIEEINDFESSLDQRQQELRDYEVKLNKKAEDLEKEMQMIKYLKAGHDSSASDSAATLSPKQPAASKRQGEDKIRIRHANSDEDNSKQAQIIEHMRDQLHTLNTRLTDCEKELFGERLHLQREIEEKEELSKELEKVRVENELLKRQGSPHSSNEFSKANTLFVQSKPCIK